MDAPLRKGHLAARSARIFSVETHQNPYAPPVAPVSDPEPVTTVTAPHVEFACRLMWVSFAISILDDIVKFFVSPGAIAKIAIVIGTFIGLGIGYALLSWITRKLRAGRNWMRWLITILNVAGWLSVAVFWDFYRGVFQVLASSGLALLTFGVQMILGIAVIVLLHTPSTREWFTAQTAAS